MKTGSVICDECKKGLVQPAMLDVKMRFVANSGPGNGDPNAEDTWHKYGILGAVEVEIEGDFCDAHCLTAYALRKANDKSGINAVYKVSQDVFNRGTIEEGFEEK